MIEEDWQFPEGRFLSYVLGAGRAGRRAGLHRAQRRARADRLHAAEAAGIFALDLPAQHRGRDGRARDASASGSRRQGAAALGPGVRGGRMTGFRFGPELTADGTTFRLWAPAAKSVELMVDRPLPMRRRSRTAGTRSRSRAPRRHALQIPHRRRARGARSGLAFQPDDVGGPSEVVDHGAYPWRARDWRGRPWEEAVILELHVGTFTPEGTFPRRDRQARSRGRQPASPRSS